MTVRVDCRHYSTRSVSSAEVVQRCRLDAADSAPFACPDGCVFFEERPVGGAYQFPRSGD